MGRLSVFPKPAKGQLASCYLSKLADANGYNSANHLFDSYFEEPYSQDSILSKHLRDLTGHDSHVIDNVRLYKCDQDELSTFVYGALCIPSYHLTRELLVCKSCLKEKSFMEGKWRIAWLPCCTRHQEMLVPLSELADPIFELDDKVLSTLLHIQPELETALEEDAHASSQDAQRSIVALVDKHLRRSLKPDKLDSLQRRNRKYSRRYFPYKRSEALLFMECLYDQLIA